MEYTLMHKNIPVFDLEFTPSSGVASRIGKMSNPEHIPLGIVATSGYERGKVSCDLFNDWWGRSIPSNRDGLKPAMEAMHLHSTRTLTGRCNGLSLSDQYWIRPRMSRQTWDSINFFTNEFSLDVGKLLFGKEIDDMRMINLMSPDNTTDGWLRKRWIAVEGKQYLMKGGSGQYCQEPFNELIATAILRRLKLPHAKYTLTFDDGKPYCLSENIVTPQTDMIPVCQVMKVREQESDESHFTHLLLCCDKLGIPNARDSLNKMLTIDFIISNEDRHWNNFAVLRDADTLEFLGFSPFFDNGSSLWYSTANVGSQRLSKPFKNSFLAQLRLVNDFTWFDIDALFDIGDEIMSIFSFADEALIPVKRQLEISSAVKERIDSLASLSSKLNLLHA
jgi:hypothetical protein